ncbi:MAG: toxin-antitoxin system, antitoxin component [Candidatus Uhrbacteria bacterium]|nr:toxin-antitoxin system, antitoxin component [Candidatus Uhrbacteria bacterium]
MATEKKRINVSLSKPTYIALSYLAKRDDVPFATKASALIEEALELEEDIAFNYLARQRESEGGVDYRSHEEVWSKYGL